MPRLPIIDTDIHPVVDANRVADFLAEPWRTRWRSGNRGALPLGYWNPNGVRRVDAVTDDGDAIASDPQLLSRLFFDVYDIEYGVLVIDHQQIALTPDMDYASAACAAINDVIVNDWLPVDPRFRAAIYVSPLDPEAAAREIHRLGDHPGVVQVFMPSGARMPYGQRFYHPIYAAAVAHGLPVAIHPGTEGVGVAGAPTTTGYPTSYLEWHTDLVTGYISHLVSLVCEGAFQKFPDLRFVMIEGGVSWLPPLLWRFDKNWKALRQLAPWLTQPPSEIVTEHIRLTTQPIEEPDRHEHFTAMMDMFDAAHMLMFSSDYPHWDGDTPDFVGGAFRPELRPRILSETAREIYRLPEATHAAT